MEHVPKEINGIALDGKKNIYLYIKRERWRCFLNTWLQNTLNIMAFHIQYYPLVLLNNVLIWLKSLVKWWDFKWIHWKYRIAGWPSHSDLRKSNHRYIFQIYFSCHRIWLTCFFINLWNRAPPKIYFFLSKRMSDFGCWTLVQLFISCATLAMLFMS